jgi:hypothetical protein
MVSVLLFIGVLIFTTISVLTTRKNYSSSFHSRMIPFSATVGSDGRQNNFTTVNTQGETVNQLSCPVGYKINVIGAMSQVVDPYGECLGAGPGSRGMTNVLKTTCGVNGTNTIPTPVGTDGWKCSSDSDCGADDSGNGLFECNSNGQCQLKSFNVSSGQYCDLSSDPHCDGLCSEMQGAFPGVYACIDTATGGPCSSSTTAGVCIEKNICYGITYNGQDSKTPTGEYMTGLPFGLNGSGNPVCVPGSQELSPASRCVVRDVSAYVAKNCDGQETCSLTTADCGPYPCDLAPPSGGCQFGLTSAEGSGAQDFTYERAAGGGFCSLPVAYGYGGGPPLGESEFSNAQANVSMGYQIHGLYTCVPANE